MTRPSLAAASGNPSDHGHHSPKQAGTASARLALTSRSKRYPEWPSVPFSGPHSPKQAVTCAEAITRRGKREPRPGHHSPRQAGTRVTFTRRFVERVGPAPAISGRSSPKQAETVVNKAITRRSKREPDRQRPSLAEASGNRAGLAITRRSKRKPAKPLVPRLIGHHSP